MDAHSGRSVATSSPQAGSKVVVISQKVTAMPETALADNSPGMPTARWKNIAFMLLRITFAISLVWAGSLKLIGSESMVHTFATVGLGQWFRIFTGLCEIATATLLMFPTTIGFGALLGFAVFTGATVANIFVLHQDYIHSTVPAIIMVIIVWNYRVQPLRLLMSIMRSTR